MSGSFRRVVISRTRPAADAKARGRHPLSRKGHPYPARYPAAGVHSPEDARSGRPSPSGSVSGT